MNAGVNMPNNVTAREVLFFAKYRVRNTRQYSRCELNEIRQEPKKSCLAMINKFQTITTKLEWCSAMSHILSPVIHQVALQLLYQSVAFQDETQL